MPLLISIVVFVMVYWSILVSLLHFVTGSKLGHIPALKLSVVTKHAVCCLVVSSTRGSCLPEGKLLVLKDLI